MKKDGGERWIKDDEAARFLALNRQTLANWRFQGRGPTYTRLGGRAIRYKFSDVAAFAESRKVATE